MKDIKRSKVVISMLSGGMNDALIIDKPIIQANFLCIVEPKGLDRHNAVYYADSVTSLINLIDDFFNILSEIVYLNFGLVLDNKSISKLAIEIHLGKSM